MALRREPGLQQADSRSGGAFGQPVLFEEISGCEGPFSGVCNACLWTGKQMAAFEWFKPQDLIQDHETGQGKHSTTFARLHRG